MLHSMVTYSITLVTMQSDSITVILVDYYHSLIMNSFKILWVDTMVFTLEFMVVLLVLVAVSSSITTSSKILVLQALDYIQVQLVLETIKKKV